MNPTLSRSRSKPPFSQYKKLYTWNLFKTHKKSHEKTYDSLEIVN